ncbi:discoidin domain-containing protein [Paenibacillus terrigena]|uniref:discoidin domain-containing protein n=1 Tax=Paenibacillus terrigena TaxID=369333 RepID=UPI0028D21C77|nr:discoidin domain-containing protein [Paenibacillus terrigena]
MKRILSFTLVVTMLFGMVSVTAVSANDVVKTDNMPPLIASMKFDNTLNDDANQEILTANGNHSFVDGVLPGTKALHLESGDGNYVGTTHSLNVGNDSFTTSFWYKGDTKNDQVILSNKDFTKSSNAGWAIYTSANSVNMNLGFPTESVKFGRDTFNASAWRYVTFVVDRDKMLGSLYIDGYKMTETSLGVGTLDTSNPLNIGSDGLGTHGGNSFDIADLNVWKGALSGDVVQANYKSYGVNKVDMKALNDTISEANTIITSGLGNGFSQTDFDYLKNVFNMATSVATTQKVKLYTQETINYYERELNNAIFIYQKSNKTLTPADLNITDSSDPEISSNPATIARVEEDYRKALKVFPQADVLVQPGDITGGNNANEYVWMGELTKVYNRLKGEGLFDTTKLYIVKGNHDMDGTQNLIPVGTAGAWNESTNSYDNDFYNSAYRVKIKGYNLIGFDANINSSSTVGKAKNLLNQIKSEADYDPTKPIFAMSHYPIGGTVWSERWNSGASNNFGQFIADNNFSQVFYMSGHTQYDPTDERSLYQGAATYLDSGGSNYSSYIDDGPYGGYKEGAYINYHTTPRITNFLEVYGTKIIIKQYNLATDEFVSIPRVVNVGEGKDAFTYSKSDKRELIAPQFDEGIKIDSYNNNELAFTIKQANDNVRVLEYNIQLINKLTGKVDKSFNSLSLPLDKPYDEYRQYKFTGLSPTTPYMLRVFADDSMYNRSSQDIDLKSNSGNLISITAPADKTAVIGSAKTANALGLPETVALVTDEGFGYANVTWNVDASNYDPTVTTVQTFTVNGTVILPTGVANPNNVPLTTSISVIVNKIIQSATATSEETEGENSAASMAIDGNPLTMWHTKWDKSDVLPQSITLKLGAVFPIDKVKYLPRQEGSNGIITGYNVYVSKDGVTFTKVASGTWANNNAEKVATFDPTDALYVKLEATAGVNGWASAAEINVTTSEPLAPPATTLTGLQQVSSGQTFNLTMGLTGVTQSVYQQVYGQDLTLHYDPANVKFDSVTSLNDGFQVIDQKEKVPGQVRIMAASVGSKVPAQSDLLKFNFTAKSATELTTITVDHVVIANSQGNELEVKGASHEIQIGQISIPVDKSLLNALITSAQAKYDAAVEGNGHGQYVNGAKAQLQSAIALAKATANDPNATQQQVDSAKAALEAAIQVFDTKKINADVNGDGSISIGDLAIVAAAYGKQPGQAGWNEKADVNKDGKVDIVDLAIAAKAILQ